MDNSSTVDIFINSSSIFQTNFDIPMNIRPLSLNIQKIRMAIIVFGTLINFLVIVVICNSRQLFYPRHMYWVAISLINQKCISFKQLWKYSLRNMSIYIFLREYIGAKGVVIKMDRVML